MGSHLQGFLCVCVGQKCNLFIRQLKFLGYSHDSRSWDLTGWGGGESTVFGLVIKLEALAIQSVSHSKFVYKGNIVRWREREQSSLLFSSDLRENPPKG